MNRIQPLSKRAELQVHADSAVIENGTRRNAAVASSAAANAFFAPLHYEPNYAYPLVVWLHGPHDNENQLKKVMPLVSLRNYVGAAPRATAVSEKDDGRLARFRWLQTERHIELAERRVLDCIEAARQRFSVAPKRFFVAGLECGGTMALRLALRNPDVFAGAISFGGRFPTDRAPLARLHSVRRLPLLFATTQASRLYPAQQVCEDLRLFHSANMCVTLRQYPGDDGLTDLMLSDMDRWIMEQINAAPGPSELLPRGSAN